MSEYLYYLYLSICLCYHWFSVFVSVDVTDSAGGSGTKGKAWHGSDRDYSYDEVSN